MSFGIALSGGGAKGAAHVGVLMALCENNLIPSSVSGTSMGAIVGGLYAIGYPPEKLKEIIIKFSKNYRRYIDPCYGNYFMALMQFMSNSSITLPGFIKGDKVERYLKNLTKNIAISSVQTPLVIPAVDLISGKTIVYSNIHPKMNSTTSNVIWKNDIPLHSAMRASSSLPAIFYPKKINNAVLVDGGITHIIPTELLMQTGEKNILAINISQEYEKPKSTNIFEITTHSFELMQNELKNFSLGKEKFLITPKLPKNAEMLSFNHMPEFVKAGYNSTIAVMPKLKQLFS